MLHICWRNIARQSVLTQEDAMYLCIRPERSLSPPSAVICLIRFMSVQIERMLWNDWCQRHNLVITPGSTSWPSPTAQWRRVPHELWSIPPSPLKALAGSIRLQLQPSFRRDNKDLMQTRTYLRVPVGACVRSESSPPCEDDLTDPHAEGERGRECLRWRLLYSLRELWLMRCTAFSQANASEGCAINLGKRGRPRQYDAFRLAEDNISPWQALPMNN